MSFKKLHPRLEFSISGVQSEFVTILVYYSIFFSVATNIKPPVSWIIFITHLLTVKFSHFIYSALYFPAGGVFPTGDWNSDVV